MKSPFSSPPPILQMKGCMGQPGSSGGGSTSGLRTRSHTHRISALSRGLAFRGTHSVTAGRFPTNAVHRHGIPVCRWYPWGTVLPHACCSCCYNLSYKGHNDERGGLSFEELCVGIVRNQQVRNQSRTVRGGIYMHT